MFKKKVGYFLIPYFLWPFSLLATEGDRKPYVEIYQGTFHGTSHPPYFIIIIRNISREAFDIGNQSWSGHTQHVQLSTDLIDIVSQAYIHKLSQKDKLDPKFAKLIEDKISTLRQGKATLLALMSANQKAASDENPFQIFSSITLFPNTGEALPSEHFEINHNTSLTQTSVKGDVELSFGLNTGSSSSWLIFLEIIRQKNLIPKKNSNLYFWTTENNPLWLQSIFDLGFKEERKFSYTTGETEKQVLVLKIHKEFFFTQTKAVLKQRQAHVIPQPFILTWRSDLASQLHSQINRCSNFLLNNPHSITLDF